MAHCSAPIRVLLADMPPMLGDIVRQTVENERDMVVVGELDLGVTGTEAASQLGADVLIVGVSEPGDADVPVRLLRALPEARVLMLAVDGRSAVAYELRPRQTRIGDVSPETLIQAIRAMVASCVSHQRDYP